MLDFDSGVYYPIRAFLSGENPYDRQRFLSLYPVSDGFPPYPPLTLLLHLPFGLLPHALAAPMYAIFTLGVMLIFARIALQAASRDPTTAAVLLLAAALLLTRPGHWNLVLGQRAAVLALGSYLALFKARQAPWLAAAGLTVAMLKPTWGVPLAILMLARGDLRAVGASVFLTLAINLPLLALIAHRAGGPTVFMQRLLQGYHQWQEVSDVDPATSVVRIDAATTISRFVGHPLADLSQILLTVFVIAIAAAAVRQMRRDRSRAAGELTVGVTCTAVLLCGHHVGYDFLLLTVSALTVFFYGVPASGDAAVRLLFLGLFAVPALNWLATESVLGALRPGKALWLVIASLNGVALIVLFSGYVWLAARWSLQTDRVALGSLAAGS